VIDKAESLKIKSYLKKAEFKVRNEYKNNCKAITQKQAQEIEQHIVGLRNQYYQNENTWEERCITYERSPSFLSLDYSQLLIDNT
jgi:hypothetical protein